MPALHKWGCISVDSIHQVSINNAGNKKKREEARSYACESTTLRVHDSTDQLRNYWTRSESNYKQICGFEPTSMRAHEKTQRDCETTNQQTTTTKDCGNGEDGFVFEYTCMCGSNTAACFRHIQRRHSDLVRRD